MIASIGLDVGARVSSVGVAEAAGTRDSATVAVAVGIAEGVVSADDPALEQPTTARTTAGNHATRDKVR